MAEETREFETDSFVQGYIMCAGHQWLENSWFVRGKKEIQEIDMQ